ncbi:MAG TPA: Sec-independent protein translocase protein TatB [Acidimicrobiales bacterium]
MFNVGGGEILVILLLALVVLGPDKLPETARKVGRYVNEFRRMTSGFQEEFRQAMDLGATDSTDGTESAPDDAVHRTSPGPRLLASPEIPTAPTEPGTTATTSGSIDAAPERGQGPTSGTTGRAAFAADVTPAPGTGPELVTPSRPDTPTGDETGSTSAA